jgi:hypothetical protein
VTRKADAAAVAALMLAMTGMTGCASKGAGAPVGHEYRIGQVIYWVGPDRPAGERWEPSGKDITGDTIWKRPVTPADREKGQ